MASPPAAVSLPVSAVTTSVLFGGLGLADVPPEFGWDSELFEPLFERPGVKSAAGPSEVQTGVVDVVDMDDDSSPSEGDSDDVHIPGEPQPEPSPVFEEMLDDFAEKVADIDVDLGEEPETPVENVKQHWCKNPKPLNFNSAFSWLIWVGKVQDMVEETSQARIYLQLGVCLFLEYKLVMGIVIVNL
ncbi:hypothetical protein Cgig2_024131 [Carnegiea gigantea]|uniref:Uncharacterized protein n=1 Tax=Carnegiea gigantea TaxID=171969 RepID=A0A9Q1JV68_9CARY|nr:hypothetical protein Cgig2_024131 [Carnegiea gigantea]